MDTDKPEEAASPLTACPTLALKTNHGNENVKNFESTLYSLLQLTIIVHNFLQIMHREAIIHAPNAIHILAVVVRGILLQVARVVITIFHVFSDFFGRERSL